MIRLQTTKEHLTLAISCTVLVAMTTFMYKKVSLSGTLRRKAEALEELKKSTGSGKVAPSRELSAIDESIEAMTRKFNSIDKLVQSATKGFIPQSENRKRSELELKIAQLSEQLGISTVTNKTVIINSAGTKRRNGSISISDYQLPVRKYELKSSFYQLHSFIYKLSQLQTRIAILDLKITRASSTAHSPQLLTELTLAY